MTDDGSSKICSVTGCDREARHIGMCSAHYQRDRRGTGAFGPIGPPRQTAKIDADGCAFDGCSSKRVKVHRNGHRNGRSRWCSFHRLPRNRPTKTSVSIDRFRTAPPPR